MKWSHLNNYTKEKYVLKNCRILDFWQRTYLRERVTSWLRSPGWLDWVTSKPLGSTRLSQALEVGVITPSFLCASENQTQDLHLGQQAVIH